MKPNFKDSIRFSEHLIGFEMGKTDTDSFVYEIETEDFFRDIAGDVKTRLDTSGYSKDDN